MPTRILLNFRNRAKFAARNPAYTVRSLLNDWVGADERFVAGATGVPFRRVRSFLTEPFAAGAFRQRLKECEKELAGVEAQGADLYAKKVLAQYVLVRAVEPDVVVETGVANGVSSAYILLALERNARGHLYSVDIGEGEFLPAGRETGWVVPQSLRARWSLHLGDAKLLLPRLLAELGEVDIFIHDCLHTYEHMLWEFRAAYPSLREGGFLVADDALWNAAFPEFARAVQSRHVRIIRGVGYLRKDSANIAQLSSQVSEPEPQG